MSTAPLGTGPLRPRRPRLRVVPPPVDGARRTPFVLVVVGIITGGLLLLLILNTQLAQGAFVLHDLQRTTTALEDQQQMLTESLARDESPNVLAARAAGLGMVPGGDPVFLVLPGGRVLGDPAAAVGRRPVVPASPSASASASPQPSGSARRPAGGASPSAGAHPLPKPSARPSAKASPSAAASPGAKASLRARTSPGPRASATRRTR